MRNIPRTVGNVPARFYRKTPGANGLKLTYIYTHASRVYFNAYILLLHHAYLCAHHNTRTNPGRILERCPRACGVGRYATVPPPAGSFLSARARRTAISLDPSHTHHSQTNNNIRFARFSFNRPPSYDYHHRGGGNNVVVPVYYCYRKHTRVCVCFSGERGIFRRSAIIIAPSTYLRVIPSAAAAAAQPSVL